MYMYNIYSETLQGTSEKRNNLHTKNTLQNTKYSFSHKLHFEHLISRQPLYKGQNGWHQRVRYLEVS